LAGNIRYMWYFRYSYGTQVFWQIKLTHMKRIFFWFDYVVGYIVTNPHKLPYYHRMMYETYGEWYCTEEEFKEYWDGDQVT